MAGRESQGEGDPGNPARRRTEGGILVRFPQCAFDNPAGMAFCRRCGSKLARGQHWLAQAETDLRALG
jgi:hypothetical protein